MSISVPHCWFWSCNWFNRCRCGFRSWIPAIRSHESNDGWKSNTESLYELFTYSVGLFDGLLVGILVGFFVGIGVGYLQMIVTDCELWGRTIRSCCTLRESDNLLCGLVRRSPGWFVRRPPRRLVWWPPRWSTSRVSVIDCSFAPWVQLDITAS